MPRRTMKRARASGDTTPSCTRNLRESTKHPEPSLKYNQKYHPADNVTRPSQAKKYHREKGLKFGTARPRTKFWSGSDSDTSDDEDDISDPSGFEDDEDKSNDDHRSLDNRQTKHRKRKRTNSSDLLENGASPSSYYAEEGIDMIDTDASTSGDTKMDTKPRTGRVSTQAEFLKYQKRYIKAWKDWAGEESPGEKYERYADRYAMAWVTFGLSCEPEGSSTPGIEKRSSHSSTPTTTSTAERPSSFVDPSGLDSDHTSLFASLSTHGDLGPSNHMESGLHAGSPPQSETNSLRHHFTQLTGTAASHGLEGLEAPFADLNDAMPSGQQHF